MNRILLLLGLVALLGGCSSSQTWGWYVIDPTKETGWINVRFLLSGMGSTISISLIDPF